MFEFLARINWIKLIPADKKIPWSCKSILNYTDAKKIAGRLPGNSRDRRLWRYMN